MHSHTDLGFCQEINNIPSLMFKKVVFGPLIKISHSAD